MGIYKSFKGLDFIGHDILSTYTETSFGNMGFTKAICSKAPIKFGQTVQEKENAHPELMFQCEHTTTISGIQASGLLLDTRYGGEDNTIG